MGMTRATYIASRTALAKQILANPEDLAARQAYYELKAVYLASVMPGLEDSVVWRASLPAMARKQAD